MIKWIYAPLIAFVIVATAESASRDVDFSYKAPTPSDYQPVTSFPLDPIKKQSHPSPLKWDAEERPINAWIGCNASDYPSSSTKAVFFDDPRSKNDIQINNAKYKYIEQQGDRGQYKGKYLVPGLEAVDIDILCMFQIIPDAK